MTALRALALPSAGDAGDETAAQRAPLTAFIWAAAAMMAVFAVHAATTWSMVTVWSRSNTYAHGFIVVPVVLGWLWLRRRTLALLPVQPWWPGLPALACLSLLWWMSNTVGANAAQQFAVVAMVPALIATVFGVGWVRALLLPLAFLFFAVPAGDVLIPALTEWTADFVMLGLQVLDVPVFREADQVLISSGVWRVKESCSGIRYLMACATLGTIYAAMTYRSTRKRWLFIGGLVLFAVVANWVRALGIVLLAHHTDNKLAVGVDHLIYGWVFFGVVLGTAFGVGGIWRDDMRLRDAPAARPVRPPTWIDRMPWPIAVAVASVALIGVWPLQSRFAAEPPSAASAALTVRAAPQWTPKQSPSTTWRPSFRNATHQHAQVYERDGKRVTLVVAAYRNASRDAKLVSSSNRLIAVDDPAWNVVDRGAITVPLHGRGVALPTTTIASAAERVTVSELYWVDGFVTGHRARAAVEDMLHRLRGGRHTSAWLVIYAADPSVGPADIAQFVRDMGPAIDEALARDGAAR
jgi:exosortase A